MDESTWERLERVRRMECARIACTQAVSALTLQLERMDALLEQRRELLRYYGSADWLSDREAPLPEGTPAGVLSEDLVYDLITDSCDAARHMRALAEELLKTEG